MVHNWFKALVTEDFNFLKQSWEGHVGFVELKELVRAQVVNVESGGDGV